MVISPPLLMPYATTPSFSEDPLKIPHGSDAHPRLAAVFTTSGPKDQRTSPTTPAANTKDLTDVHQGCPAALLKLGRK
jgi:hypothetical protein